MNKIDQFKDEYFFLSNFYNAKVNYKNHTYQNNEAAFQAQKSLNKKDFENVSPSVAKHMGRSCTLPSNWEDVKDEHMLNIVRAKFYQHPSLAQRLLSTNDAELIEGNWWGDTYWGVCKGKGQNRLGKILMKVREEIKESCC